MMNALRKIRKDDSGSAIVTVLVVVLVISILATTILYMAFSNFKMKKTDQQNKESFYESETTLEEIKINLLYMTSSAAEKAYIDTLTNYANMTADVRKSSYYNSFVSEFEKLWDKKLSIVDPSGSLAPDVRVNKALETLYTHADGKNDVVFVASGGIDPTSGVVIDKSHASDGYIVIRGVYLTYIDSNYVSKIQTDYIIEAPEYEYGVGPDSTGTEVEPKKIDLTNCVQYSNWVKK